MWTCTPTRCPGAARPAAGWGASRRFHIMFLIFFTFSEKINFLGSMPIATYNLAPIGFLLGLYWVPLAPIRPYWAPIFLSLSFAPHCRGGVGAQ